MSNYLYASNNPFRYVDRLGLSPCSIDTPEEHNCVYNCKQNAGIDPDSYWPEIMKTFGAPLAAYYQVMGKAISAAAAAEGFAGGVAAGSAIYYLGAGTALAIAFYGPYVGVTHIRCTFECCDENKEKNKNGGGCK